MLYLFQTACAFAGVNDHSFAKIGCIRLSLLPTLFRVNAATKTAGDGS